MDFKTKLTEYVANFQQQGYFNGSLLVADATGILLEQSFGLASVEFGIKNTNETKYQIGSLTKAFTSVAVLMLQHQGSLNITDTISNYIPDFPNGDKITLYQCMTCTSGIPDFVRFDSFWEVTMRLSWTLDEMIAAFKDIPLDFEPGTQFSYSTSGYLLLTKIIEIVSGKSYAAYMEEMIFLPLGMHNTGCSNETDIIPMLASNYSFWEKEIRTPQTNLSFPLGGYGLYSTIHDLYLWDQAIRTHQLIPKNLTKLMFAIHKNSYACGWDITEIDNRVCRQHFGNISGFVSSIKQFEEDDLTIIFLSNLDIIPVTIITKEIAQLKFGREIPQILTQPKIVHYPSLSNFTGKYVKDQAQIFEIVAEHDDLFLIVPKLYEIDYKLKLTISQSTENEIILRTEKINETILFTFDKNAELEKIIYTDYHRNSVAVAKQRFSIEKN